MFGIGLLGWLFDWSKDSLQSAFVVLCVTFTSFLSDDVDELKQKLITSDDLNDRFQRMRHGMETWTRDFIDLKDFKPSWQRTAPEQSEKEN